METPVLSSWNPKVIRHRGRAYLLRYSIRCRVVYEGKVCSIDNGLLGIVGTGKSRLEAEKSLMQEFDFVYRRYTGLPDRQLVTHLVKAKNHLKHLVREVLPCQG